MQEIWEERYTLPVPRKSNALTSQWCRNKSEGFIYISDNVSYSRITGFFRQMIVFQTTPIKSQSRLFFFIFIDVESLKHKKMTVLPNYYSTIFSSCTIPDPSYMLSLWYWTTVCLGLPWGQVRFWAQLGRMMNNNWEMSRWVPESRLVLCEWRLPAERAPIIRGGQQSQVTCLYDRARPRWPLWPVLQWEIMHRLCRSPNSPACPEQGPSPL